MDSRPIFASAHWIVVNAGEVADQIGPDGASASAGFGLNVFANSDGFVGRRDGTRYNQSCVLIAGEGDSLIPVAQARFMASKLQKGEFHTLACKHFEPYLGEWFEKNIALQLDFLKRVLA